ncbi:MAG: hypothetical protein IPI40_18475 [Betaproteobacteria bacterium]|nr:hypothetical protein [Betaproteobacteria bacterium]
MLPGVSISLVGLGAVAGIRRSGYRALAHGSVAMLGGYATLIIIQKLGFNLWVAALLAMPIAALVGVLIGGCFIGPCETRRQSTLLSLRLD